MLLENRFWISFEEAVQAQRLIHFIQMVHEVIIPDNLAKPAAAAAYQTVVLAEAEGEAGGAQQRVGRIQNVGQNTGATPGVEADTICRVGAFTASGGWNPSRGKVVEFGAALSGEGFQA